MITPKKPKAVILAGGFGTRLSEETHTIPKPMVEVGGKPILVHVMNCFAKYGVNEFIILAGYKQEVIKKYFASYFLHNADIDVSLSTGKINIINQTEVSWNVKVIDTGLNSMTGGRLLRVKEHLQNEDSFFFTYGDGVSDVNIDELFKFHCLHGKIATLTSVAQPSRFGHMQITDNNKVTKFAEKALDSGGLINGGFMCLKPDVFDYLENDQTVFEQEPLMKLAENEQLYTYEHSGFWQAMDTLRDKINIEKLIESGEAKWM